MGLAIFREDLAYGVLRLVHDLHVPVVTILALYARLFSRAPLHQNGAWELFVAVATIQLVRLGYVVAAITCLKRRWRLTAMARRCARRRGARLS